MADLVPARPPRKHRRRNEAFVHGLRHERNHWTSAARRPRRPQAGASPRAVRHEDDGPVLDARLSQVRQDRRRGDGQLPSPWRCVHLRHPGADGAGLQHALPARERAGQFRIDRRRPAGGDAVYRGAAPVHRRRHDGRSRQGDRRLRSQLRRDHRGAVGSSRSVPQPARQRLGGYRGRHGHQRAAAQSPRGHRRLHLADREHAFRGGRHAAEHRRQAAQPDSPDSGARFPDRRPDRRPPGRRAGVHDRPRLDHDARPVTPSKPTRRATGRRSSSPRFRIRSTRRS